MAAELAPLKDQLKEIQSTLKNFGTNNTGQQSLQDQETLQSYQLLQQMQNFSFQAQQQR